MSEAKRFVVSGKVQGVWFRRATEQVAHSHQIKGWVRNLDDGSVEVVATGNEFALKQLEKWLEQGPTHARVERVVIEQITADIPEVFEVR